MLLNVQTRNIILIIRCLENDEKYNLFSPNVFLSTRASFSPNVIIFKLKNLFVRFIFLSDFGHGMRTFHHERPMLL